MKKFLSLILALSMIISCVSMVSFVANAEEAQEPVGVQITSKELLTGTSYPRAKANFTADDVVWGDTNDDTSGNTSRQGSITRSFTVFNNSDFSYSGSIGFYGGNRKATNSPAEGWEGLKQESISLSAGGVKTVSVTFKVYEFAADGEIVVKIDSTSYPSKYSEVVGYAPLNTVYLRVNADKNTEANASIFIMPKAGESTVLFNLANQGKVTVTKVYELPVKEYIDNGDAENGSTGWGTIHGGSVSIVADPDDENNKVAKLTATGAYHSVFYDFGPAIFDDAEQFYNGSGAGYYELSFRYRAESLEGYDGNAKFSVMLNSQCHQGTSSVTAALGADAYASDTYFGNGSITMTEEWQTYTKRIQITEDFYNMIKALRYSSIGNAARAYEFGLRFDGGTNAFANQRFNYLVDDIEFKYVQLNGMLFEITTPGASGYPLFRGNTGLTQAMADENNVLSATFDVYNMGENDCTVELMYQAINGWTNFEGSSATATVSPEYKTSVTINMLTDGNGNLVKKDGSVVDEIKDATVRLNITAASAKATQKILIVPTNEVAEAIYNVKYDGGAGNFTTGGGAAVCDKYFGELPAYSTPTPTPTPEPETAGYKHTFSSAIGGNGFKYGRVKVDVSDEIVWDESYEGGSYTVANGPDKDNVINMIKKGTISRTYTVKNDSNSAAIVKAGFFAGNRLGQVYTEADQEKNSANVAGTYKTGAVEGWEGQNVQALNLAAHESAKVTIYGYVYILEGDTTETPVYKIGDSRFVNTEKVQFVGFAPVNTTYLRFNVEQIEAGGSVILSGDDLASFKFDSNNGGSADKPNYPNNSTVTNGKEYVEDTAEFAGAQVDVGSTLTMNFHTELGENVAEGAKLVVTRNGRVEEITETKTVDGKTVFSYAGVNAQCMNDEITAQIVDGEGNVVSAKTYTFKENAVNLYNNRPYIDEDTPYSDEQYAALKKFLATMLNYGAESQKHQNYKEDQLVTKDLDWTELKEEAPGAPTVENPVKSGNDKAGAQVTSVGMNIGSEYKLYFKFNNFDSENYRVFFVVGGEEKEITNEIDAGRYDTAGIKAHENDKVFTVKIVEKNNVENVVSQVNYSVNNYINKKYSSSNVGDIVKSIHSYGVAAEAYIAAMTPAEA